MVKLKVCTAILIISAARTAFSEYRYCISGSQKNFIISIELTENTVFIIKPIKNISTTGATLPNNTIKKFFLVSARLFLLADTKFFDSKQKHV